MKSKYHFIKTFWIKATHWEFWPTAVVYFPVILLYPFWAIASWDLFFFRLVNPKMTMGGLYGSSKFESLKHLKAEFKPKTELFRPHHSFEQIIAGILNAGMSFPLIVKPDLGERGKGVEKVNNQAQLECAFRSQTSPFVIQSYLDKPFEAGIFYTRLPSQSSGIVSSIVIKVFLEIVGDGKSTIAQLAAQNKRAVLIWKNLLHNLEKSPGHVLKQGERLLLEPIGNHSRGTAFNSGNHLINEALSQWAESAAQKLPEFYYGRFDVRADSLEDFLKGETIKIMEVNGANAEPAHIYEEGFSLVEGMSTLVSYWHTIFLISRQNKKRFKRAKYAEAWLAYKAWKQTKSFKYNSFKQPLNQFNT